MIWYIDNYIIRCNLDYVNIYADIITIKIINL